MVLIWKSQPQVQFKVFLLCLGCGDIQRQLGESLKQTLLTDKSVPVTIHRTDKSTVTITIAKKSTVSDLKTKLTIPPNACLHWKGINTENHYHNYI